VVSASYDLTGKLPESSGAGEETTPDVPKDLFRVAFLWQGTWLSWDCECIVSECLIFFWEELSWLVGVGQGR